MKARAARSPRREAAPEQQRSSRRAPSPAAHGAGTPFLQRCACGGSCPRCRAEDELSVQPKLHVNRPGDRYEQEADRVADAVLRMPDSMAAPLPITSLTQRQVRAAAAASPVSAEVASGIRESHGRGCALPTRVRQSFEGRFGHDFSKVRVHAGREAAELAASVRARAFTVGHDMFFGAGQFAPQTLTGKALLAHELTHVLQQKASPLLLQRALDDQHNLTSTLLSGDPSLEACFDGHATLRLFDKGTAVMRLQQALIQLGYFLPSGADNVFGEETHDAVIQFQKDVGLTGSEVDGVVGKKTIGLLDVAVRHGAVGKDEDASSSDFKVTGKAQEPKTDSEEEKKQDKNPTKVFFDLASAELDEEETKKIEELAKRHQNEPLTLIGYASEEGPTALNKTLAQRRVDAVDQKLAPLHDSIRILANNAEAGAGKIAYRSFRSVEIIAPGQKTAHPKQSGCANEPEEKKLCPTPNTPLSGAVTRAKGMIAEAVKVLQAIKEGKPTAKNSEDKSEDKLDKNFPYYKGIFITLFRNNDSRPLAETVDAVIEIFNKIDSYLGELVKESNSALLLRCGTQCDERCTGGRPAYEKDTEIPGAIGRITLCPAFFETDDIDYRARVIIHEGHHGTPDIASSDIAYQNTRLIDKLDHNKALQNAASFHVFAQLVDKPHSRTIGPAQQDVVFIKEVKKREQFNLSLAFIEQWFTLSTFDTASLYAGIRKARKENLWNEGEHLMKCYFAPRFGFTKPPTIPPQSEQTAVAAIYDRLRLMEDAFGDPLTITETVQHDEWERGPGDEIKVTDAMLNLDQQRQVIAIVQELVRATPGISARLEPEYVILINDLRRGRRLDPGPVAPPSC